MAGWLKTRIEKTQYLSLAISLLLHGTLALILFLSSRQLQRVPELSFLTVDLVTLSPQPEKTDKSIDLEIANPTSLPRAEPPRDRRTEQRDEDEAIDVPLNSEPQNRPLQNRASEISPETEARSDTRLNEGATPSRNVLVSPSETTAPPSRWALQPPLSEQNVKRWSEEKGIEADIGCIRSLSEACRNMRKEVFAAYRLTETEKVWTPKFAHTGLSADFYGMSEREIREKLSIPIAGENGIYIPFTNIGMDGGLWDSLHGVNKGCQITTKIDSEQGRQTVKDCGGLLPARKEPRN
ncbi:hypothetical protein DES40_0251 [Litorimonas taeanensis]|uniref:Uncharacterized protein n=1 Tax=Litorimonas taeanensis TaxID=568099 RepID=A0A420WIT9_9PROT|nr:hypothetical protein [Litorimonas taeanensis]RKQ70944.1 hypothetical protein DES40_0251 [Litorimonas taeanensis]